MLKISRQVELKESVEWLKRGLHILRERPLQFIVLGIMGTLFGLIPIFGAFVSPLFNAQFARLTLKVEGNNQIPLGTIWHGMLSNRAVNNLALVNVCFNLVFFLAQFWLDGFLKTNNIDLVDGISNNILLMGVLLVPNACLMFAMWLSPIICLQNPDISLKGAMLLSLKVCCFNISALLIYSLLVAVFTVCAIIPFGLGLLVWLPILSIANLYIYRSLVIKE